MAYQKDKQWTVVKVSDSINKFRDQMPGRISSRNEDPTRKDSDRRLELWRQTADYFDAL